MTSSSLPESAADVSRGLSIALATSSTSSGAATASAMVMASMVRATLMSFFSWSSVTVFSPTSRSINARSRSPTVTTDSLGTFGLASSCTMGTWRVTSSSAHRWTGASWRQMELALDHAETEVAVDDHRPVIGCKVSTMVPYLPAGETATDESFVERHTHACVEVVVLHVVPVLARGSEQ